MLLQIPDILGPTNWHRCARSWPVHAGSTAANTAGTQADR
jgi:hypothetical protein